VQCGADPGLAARAFQLRRDHARVVEDQQVPWPEQIGKVADATIREPGGIDQ
jgi:hypothetical protein